MRVGDEQYRKKLRRYNTLLFLDSPTARQSIEMAQLDRELTAAELTGRGLRAIADDYERAMALGDGSGVEG